jgi:hypothetical protein
MIRLILVALIYSALSGCVSISQVVPPGTHSAPITVSTNLKLHNIHVRYQGVNSCSSYPGKLIGMLNSATIGIDSVNPIHAQIPAGDIQVISVLGTLPMRGPGITELLLDYEGKEYLKEAEAALREPFFAFTPIEGRKYVFQFDFDGNDIVLSGYEQTTDGQRKAIESLPLPENCKNISIR